MSDLNAMITADSGINANQAWIDDLSNNIANANTIGYKDSEVQFDALFTEQLQDASAPSTNNTSAGVNSISVGSGVTVGATPLDMSEGSLEQTGNTSDVAIQGTGYLVVEQNGQQQYTRDGSLTTDADGHVATPTGGLIQGWQANSSGVINTQAPASALTIPTGETIPPQATTTLTLGGNLPSWDGSGTPPSQTTSLSAYDSLGNVVPVTLTFTGVTGSANTWTVAGTVTTPTGTTDNLWSTTAPPTVSFNPASGAISGITIPTGGSGTSTTKANGSLNLGVGAMPAGFTFPSGDTWSFSFPPAGSPTAVTQFSGQSTIGLQGDDGYASGTLSTFSIGSDGTITGSFTNGKTLALGQIALATFSNPGGLSNQGGGDYMASVNSGQAEVGTAGTGGRGTLVDGELEQSNVNLDTELTNLIQAQVAYDANTKPLTTEQQVLQTIEQLP
jgi:flagellar hook protein FlgE